MSGFHYAFSLPKSAVQQATPPGTVELYDYEGGSTSESAFSPQLRVSPTPSSCPSDPLNWSPWRKAMALLSASFYCLIANITSSSLSSALVFLAMDFHPPVAQADLTHLIAAIYTIFLVLGPIIGGIIGGYIAHAWGWRWTQWLNVIISGVSLLACFFFLPETLFDRDAAIAMAAATEDGGLEETKPTEMEKPNIEEIDRPIPVQVYEPYTFASSLKVGLYRGGLLQHFMAPWKTLRFPAVWLVMLHYGGLVGGMVTTSTVGPQFVSAPPYNWGANAGLINVGGFVGSIAGAAFTFFLADYVMKRQALRQSNGLSEPEARLPALIPGLFLATMGLLTFGFCGENPSKVGWLGLQFGYGMLTFGVMQVPSIGFNYVIESYSAFSHDCLVMITCLRAIIGFAWTFFVGTWVESRGAAEPFGIFGMFMGIVGLLTVPIYFWGKRIRIATQKWAPGQT
ncbi:hypothetical protein PDIG_16340 [Penicillium digitatum PHI26]|uniref:Major facilitator superfamily (MFS) profile domain-containing protein n=2 Tax=Penicillium digitatum TaxID=36651 RepID=K9G821_PEND2|nr:hypothetical protein PDIP_87850 [Penicillium digitatum Pd1]EKV04277.1 hypothetical protein PDIP_87850 [Penicillium digitatum Pd1]EKV17147.1 hypothetical protein PDIG_16340 [Penicillium digitatum PHI26]